MDGRAEDLVARRRRLLGRGYQLLYDEPLELVRGDGVYLFDRDGRGYLDAYNNVPVVGHCQPDVVAAIQRQVATLNTNTRYLAEPILDYAERLLATHAAELDRVLFTCSGSEAVDLALRVARQATGATGVIVTTNAYHGVTMATAAISPSLGPGAPAGPGLRTVAAPAPLGDDDGTAFAGRVERAIEVLRDDGHELAAMVVDTALVSDGIVMEPASFLGPVVATIRAAGGLFVADEVQAGFGRSGTDLWAYARHGIVPDLVTLGKPMGNGMPIAALVARVELTDGFGDAVRYFNTCAGNSVSIAAAAAVLEMIERDRLLANATSMGDRVRAGLREIAAEHPELTRVRGAGLYVAADLCDPETGAVRGDLTKLVVERLRARGVLISAVGPQRETLKIRPPLPIAAGDVDHLLEQVAATMATLTG
jgi:4-aminobutyrate aminotransferase-like enzyme